MAPPEPTPFIKPEHPQAGVAGADPDNPLRHPRDRRFHQCAANSGFLKCGQNRKVFQLPTIFCGDHDHLTGDLSIHPRDQLEPLCQIAVYHPLVWIRQQEQFPVYPAITSLLINFDQGYPSL